MPLIERLVLDNIYLARRCKIILLASGKKTLRAIIIIVDCFFNKINRSHFDSLTNRMRKALVRVFLIRRLVRCNNHDRLQKDADMETSG